MVFVKRFDCLIDGCLKWKMVEWFYKFYNKISNFKIEENVGDFRLMSCDVVENIKFMLERNFFMKGILSWVGGKIDIVEYVWVERIVGDIKFNGWKFWNLVFEGIISFFIFFFCIWIYIGLVVVSVVFIYGVWMILDIIIFGNVVRGYFLLFVLILFLGGI